MGKRLAVALIKKAHHNKRLIDDVSIRGVC